MNYVIENKKQRLGMLIVVCLGAFMANMDGTIVNVCLPKIASEMNISPSIASLLVLTYLLFETGPLLAFGKLGGLYGSRMIFLWGFVFFTVSSFFCGITSSYWLLLSMRVMQGIGGAMIFSVMLSFPAIYFPDAEKGEAIGFATMSAAMGVAAGPTIGGFIAYYFGWRHIFFINVPVGILAFIIGYIFLPRECPSSSEKRFDLKGAIIQTLFLLMFIFAINQGTELGWSSWPILGALGASVALLSLFIAHELRIPYPILNLQLFANKNTLLSTANLCFSMMVFGGIIFIMPFYLQDIRSMTVATAGLVMSILSLGQFLGPYCGKLADRKGHKLITLIGVYIGLASFIMFCTMDYGSPLRWVIAALVIFGLSQGINRAPNIQLIMTSVPPEHKGTAASVTSLMRSLGLVFGVVIFETVFSHFIPHNISIDFLSLKNSGVDVTILHDGFEMSLLAGLSISIIMVIAISFVRTKQSAS